MSAKVTKIVLGGIVVVPIACLKNENTTTRRKKEVAINTILGAKASIVKTMMILSTVTSCCGVSGADSDKFTVGTVTSAAFSTALNKKETKNKIFNALNLFNPRPFCLI